MLAPLALLKLWILSVFNRVRYDWIKELVVFLCGGIFVALAFYLAHDFLNVELRGIDETTQMSLKKIASYILCATLWIAAGKSFAEQDIAPFALRMGASPRTISIYKMLRIALIIAITALAAEWLSAKYLYAWTRETWTVLCLIGIILASIAHIVSQFLRAAKSRRDDHEKPLSQWMTRNLVTWRLAQIVTRNRLTKGSLALSLLFIVIMSYFSSIGMPSLLVALLAFIGGCFLAMCLAFQVEEDLKQAWFERHLGISDRSYNKTLFACALSLALVQSVLTIVGLSMASTYAFSEIAKVALCGAVAPMMMPLLVFQIDPRRPWIQAITVSLLGIIVATACYAHWLGIGAYMVFAYFAVQHSQGRYYRA